MELFNKKPTENKKVKKLGLSELSEDTLLNVAGGQTYHNDEDKRTNETYIKELTKKQI